MNQFKLFGISHLAFLIFECLMIILLCTTHKKIKKNKKLTTFLRYTFAIIHIGFEITYYVWALYIKVPHVPITKTLPLELCSISLYLTIFFLLLNNEKIWQFSFPITMVGATIACLLGTADGYDFPHIRFLQFFLSHGLLVITNLFGALVLDFKMGFSEYKRTLFSIYFAAFIVFFINKAIGANYMYLNWAPYPIEFMQIYFGNFFIVPLIMIMSTLYYLPVYLLNFKLKKAVEIEN